MPLTSDHRVSAANRERRRARDSEILALQRDGLSLSAIARQMSLTRPTVRTILRAGPDGVQLPPSTFRPFEPYLWARWTSGCHNARVLFAEIRAQGYTGSEIHLRRALRTWRSETAQSGRATSVSTAESPTSRRPPLRLVSPRQASWLLVSEESALDADERQFMAQLQTTLPGIGALQGLAGTFITQRRPGGGKIAHQRRGAARVSRVPGLDSHAIPSRSVSSLFRSRGSARSPAWAAHIRSVEGISPTDVRRCIGGDRR